MGEFFGHKTTAWIDLWSLEHFFSGMGVGALAVLLAHKVFLRGAVASADMPAHPPQFYFVYILLIAFIWEAVEFYMEAGYTNVAAITYWFQGVEFWGNRLITDPLLTLAGGIVGLKYAHWVWPARVFSGAWLFVHLFIFPHSMHLHDLWGI